MNFRTFRESIIIAFSTYSRIPMPKVEWNDENMKYTVCFFPLIGFAIGGISWIWMAVSALLDFGGNLRAAVLTLIPLLVTGGIHLDGLLDTADALCSWKSREERLKIMKDSHCGAFAVIWCCAYFLAAFAVFSELISRIGPARGNAFMDSMVRAAGARSGAEFSARMCQLMLVYVTSRAYSAYALFKFPKAKNSGLLRTFSDKAMNDRGARIMAVCLVILTAAVIFLSPLRGIICAAAGGIGFFLYHHLTDKTFGGITGDLAGCFVCLEELVMTAALSLVR